MSGIAGLIRPTKTCCDVTECRPPAQFSKTKSQDKMENDMKIRRFYFTKESDWVRNVRREDSDGPWCRYEDVGPLLERIKVLEKQKAEDKMKYKLELNKDELSLISQKIYTAWFEIFFAEGDEILNVKDADEKHMLSNILQKIQELK
jgi:hypothetical protein